MAERTATDGPVAGHELDVLVAERVLGWKKRLYGNGNGDWLTADGAVVPFVTIHSTPRYSTDIAAAWTIAEELHRRWGEVHLDRYRTGLWECSDTDAYSRTHSESIIGEAETAPLAICLAALNAAVPYSSSD